MVWSFRKREVQRAPMRCNWCRAPLAIQSPGGLKPSEVELHAQGALSVKRLGWFCGPRCVRSYETRFRVILEPEAVDGPGTPIA